MNNTSKRPTRWGEALRLRRSERFGTFGYREEVLGARQARERDLVRVAAADVGNAEVMEELIPNDETVRRSEVILHGSDVRDLPSRSFGWHVFECEVALVAQSLELGSREHVVLVNRIH